MNGFEFIFLLRDSENDEYACRVRESRLALFSIFFFFAAWTRRFPAINVVLNITAAIHNKLSLKLECERNKARNCGQNWKF